MKIRPDFDDVGGGNELLNSLADISGSFGGIGEWAKSTGLSQSFQSSPPLPTIDPDDFLKKGG